MSEKDTASSTAQPTEEANPSDLNPLQSTAVSSVAASKAPRSRVFDLYIAKAFDPSNETETTETRQFLEQTIVSKDIRINELKFWDKVQAWGILALNDAGLEAVKNHKGISAVRKEGIPLKFGVLPKVAKGPKKTHKYMDGLSTAVEPNYDAP